MWHWVLLILNLLILLNWLRWLLHCWHANIYPSCTSTSTSTTSSSSASAYLFSCIDCWIAAGRIIRILRYCSLLNKSRCFFQTITLCSHLFRRCSCSGTIELHLVVLREYLHLHTDIWLDVSELLLWFIFNLRLINLWIFCNCCSFTLLTNFSLSLQHYLKLFTRLVHSDELLQA